MVVSTGICCRCKLSLGSLKISRSYEHNLRCQACPDSYYANWNESNLADWPDTWPTLCFGKDGFSWRTVTNLGTRKCSLEVGRHGHTIHLNGLMTHNDSCLRFQMLMIIHMTEKGEFCRKFCRYKSWVVDQLIRNWILWPILMYSLAHILLLSEDQSILLGHRRIIYFTAVS